VLGRKWLLLALAAATAWVAWYAYNRWKNWKRLELATKVQIPATLTTEPIAEAPLPSFITPVGFVAKLA
jgi:hypothetical protein